MPARVARFVNVLGLELVGGILVLTLGAWIFGVTVEEPKATRISTCGSPPGSTSTQLSWTTFFENVTRSGMPEARGGDPVPE